MDFGRVLSPERERPLHLRPLVDMLDEATAPRRSQRLYWFSVPIRHWKSTTLRQAAVRHLCRWPDRGVAFCSHTQTFASKQSRQLRKLARQAGLEISDEAGRQDEWEISGKEGGLVARGVGGELTGRGFRLIVVDDPIKGRELAESQAERDRVWEWLQDDVVTRLDPDGALVLVHSRWHPDDPIGRVTWSPNGEWLALSLAPGGGMNTQIFVVRPDGTGLRRLTDGGKETIPAKYNSETTLGAQVATDDASFLKQLYKFDLKSN